MNLFLILNSIFLAFEFSNSDFFHQLTVPAQVFYRVKRQAIAFESIVKW